MTKKQYGIIYTAQFEHRIYVGQTWRTLKQRKKDHRTSFQRYNSIFYKTIRKYGWDVWDWSIVDKCSSQTELDKSESKWIKFYREHLFYKCLNLTSGGGNGKLSEEGRIKLSLACRGHKHSEETKQKMRKPKSEEHKKKMSQHSSWNKGIKTPDNIKEKISNSLKNRIFTKEHRKKLSTANRKRWNKKFGQGVLYEES
jgi:group I intron endonuclease